jgi:hypothetical protein
MYICVHRVFHDWRTLPLLGHIYNLIKTTTGNESLRHFLCRDDYYCLVVYPELPIGELSQVTPKEVDLVPTRHPRIFKKTFIGDTSGIWPLEIFL